MTFVLLLFLNSQQNGFWEACHDFNARLNVWALYKCVFTLPGSADDGREGADDAPTGDAAATQGAVSHPANGAISLRCQDRKEGSVIIITGK